MKLSTTNELDFWNQVWNKAYPGINKVLSKSDLPNYSLDLFYRKPTLEKEWEEISKLSGIIAYGKIIKTGLDNPTATYFRSIRAFLRGYFKHVWLEFIDVETYNVEKESWWIAHCSNGERLSLTVTLPVKDEAETLEKTIQSFIPIIDELVISIDSKSSDKSKEIAELYADKVIEHVWEKDFAKVRNHCIDACTQDWIFMTEGHVYLQPEGIPTIRQMMRSGLKEYDFIAPRIQSGNKRWFFPFLIRKDPKVRYAGSSHNYVIANKERGANVKIDLFHDQSAHKAQIRSEQRKKMNIFNFYKDLIKDHHDTRAMFYIGSDYCERGDYEKGIAMWKRRLGYKSFLQERYQTRIYLFKAFRQLGKNEEAVKMLMEASQDDSTRNEHWFALADIAEDAKNFAQAKLWLRLASQYKEPMSPMFIDKRMYAEESWKRLCALYAQDGELESALEACEKVLDYLPGDIEVLGIREQLRESIYGK